MSIKTIRHKSPLGALDVPLLGCVVERGEVVEVTAEQAERLLQQSDLWEIAPAPKPDKQPAEKSADKE